MHVATFDALSALVCCRCRLQHWCDALQLRSDSAPALRPTVLLAAGYHRPALAYKLPAMRATTATSALLTVASALLLLTPATAQAPDPVAAVTGLITRLLGPARVPAFELQVIPRAPDGAAVYELGADGSRVVLRGDSGVSLASALGAYLRSLNASWHWGRNGTGNNLAHLPVVLPPPAPARVVSPNTWTCASQSAHGHTFTDFTRRSAIVIVSFPPSSPCSAIVPSLGPPHCLFSLPQITRMCARLATASRGGRSRSGRRRSIVSRCGA